MQCPDCGHMEFETALYLVRNELEVRANIDTRGDKAALSRKEHDALLAIRSMIAEAEEDAAWLAAASAEETQCPF